MPAFTGRQPLRRLADPSQQPVAAARTTPHPLLRIPLPQVLEPGTAQLAAAVFSLLSTMIARQGNPSGAVRLLQGFSFARWALEGMVVSESNRLTGVWLLARCADLASLRYDVRRFGACLAALGALGLGARAAALGLIFRRGLYG